MADHCRKQIRDALIAGFATMATVSTVQTGRAIPIESADLPALLVYTNDESTEAHNKIGDQSRFLAVDIEGHVQGQGVVDSLDAIAAELEPLVFFAAPAWVKEIYLLSTVVELSGDAVQPAGLIRLSYTLRYHVNRAAPDVPID
jgi:hypothetical protein